LCWGRNTYDDATDVDASNEERVLESLAPHPQGELKQLEVHGYGGLAIPQWMKDPRIFMRLRKLEISNCPRCVDLPVVQLLPCLEDLSLSNMDSLTTLCRNVDVEAAGHNTPLQIFPVLKTMRLMHLPKLERWAENSAGEINSSMTFPRLESLSIINCDKLASSCSYLGMVVFVEELRIEFCSNIVRWPVEELPMFASPSTSSYLELLQTGGEGLII
jgi:hypothetical protein